MTSIVVNGRGQLKQRIKDKARERIINFLPEWKQSNLLARGVELTRIEIAAGGPALTAQELAEVAYIDGEWSKVRAVRAHSDFLEQAVDDGFAVDLDNGWPY